MHLKIYLQNTFISLILILFLPQSINAEEKKIIINTSKKEIIYDVEIANTVEKRKKGLMFKKELQSDKGMLFIFPNSKLVQIWMKNTFIPLDIIYVSKNNIITQIVKNALPNNDTIYYSKNLTKYVLEINAGQTNNHGIKIGDKLYIDKKRKKYKPKT